MFLVQITDPHVVAGPDGDAAAAAPPNGGRHAPPAAALGHPGDRRPRALRRRPPRLAALLGRSPQVRRVLCGHVHRATFETLGGVGVFTCPATFEQAELQPRSARKRAGGLAFVERGRAFAIHTWMNGTLLTQIQPV